MVRGALAVRINDGRVDRHVTTHVKDLQFRKTAPGGFDSASMKVTLPTSTFPQLGPADKVWVYDTRTGETVFEGTTDTPDAGDDDDTGQSFDLSILGTVALLSDRAERLIYLDTSFDRWRRDDTDGVNQAASAGTDVGAFPDTGNPALICQFNPGQPVGLNSQARMFYDAFVDSAQTLGAFYMTSRGGVADSLYLMEWVVPGTIIAWRELSTTGAATERFAPTNFVSGLQTLAVRLRRNAFSTNVTGDDVWAGFGGIRILGARKTRFGADLTLPRTDYVLGSEVAEDLLGRLMPFCDPFTADITTTTAHIDQLAFLEATTAAGVLEELSRHDDVDWGIGASTVSGCKFWFRPWSPTVRYSIGAETDGYKRTGAEFDQCNRQVVEWTDDKGKARVTTVTADVPELRGRVKDAERVTLPDGQGSAANASRVANALLAAKKNPPTAGTATVARPIRDLWTGR